MKDQLFATGNDFVAALAERHDDRDLSPKQPSAYALLLGRPVGKIFSNVPERPEVSTSAILGYN